MPIKVPNELPAKQILDNENIFIMSESRAKKQDIRPLKIAILNLMPKKIDTETQLLRLIGNNPIQVDVELLQTASYTPKNTPPEHLLKFYKTFDQVKDQKFDGLIITGAPIEMLEFEQVDYWQEITRIMEWSKRNVFSTFHICWGAQAGLYYHYGINKHPLEQKLSGVFEHFLTDNRHSLLHGFDDVFFAPHSRNTGVNRQDIVASPELVLLSESVEAGVFIVASRDGKQIFVTGHSEYDKGTLAGEYTRDVDKGIAPNVPANYYPQDDPSKQPLFRWKAHANLLFNNWLNYFVYQQTPFDYVDNNSQTKV